MRRLILLSLFFLTACAAGDGSANAQSAQTPPILVDQFGYLPALNKVAIIKDPEIGFDAGKSFTPSRRYAVINTATGQAVHTGEPRPWKNGKVDDLSGDRVWYFDFSKVRAPGRYVVRDVDRRVDSFAFDISPTVYTPVLKTAFKTLYLQRAGFAKTAQFAGPWADGASHLQRGQDSQSRLFNRPEDASTQRDLRGGWYDAGDYNKYTSWTAKYVTGLLGAYVENPNVWTDDFGIPESGNGIPDILDEVKWGLTWLERMQNQDGAVLSVMGLSGGSPPSSAKEPSRYGPPSTSASVAAAGAFAMAATVYRRVPGQQADAKRYASRAEKAWRWAEANPTVKFWNNDARSDSEGLAAGQQEVEADRLAVKKLMAAVHMAVSTGDPYFNRVIGNLYDSVKPMKHNMSDGHEGMVIADLLYYARQRKTPASLAARIKRDFERSVLNAHNAWPAKRNETHAYRSFVDGYWWGSNYTKSQRGSVFTQAVVAKVGGQSQTDYLNAASDYLHYIHGANPLNKVYLSNMGRYGAENSVNEFYHEWFKDGSVWDAVGSSRFGPAPGFLVGGPNDSYARDQCCATGCPGAGAAMCRLPVKTPPSGQPASKSYADFNEGWPINSWEVTENSNAYQISYLRLLSKFAR